jgi:hyperosmotically inducible protein
MRKKIANQVQMLFVAGVLTTGGVGRGEEGAKDNSEINQRDQNQKEKTAEDQGSSEADIELTRKIRRSITGESSLSTYAQNIKIITLNGVVTLKGPVRSHKEKDKVIAMARDIAGAANIKNEIEIAR